MLIVQQQGLTANIKLQPEEKLLLWCIARLSDPIGSELSPFQSPGRPRWKRVVHLATWHRLLPVLYYFTKRDPFLSEVPPGLLSQLEQTSRWTIAQHLLLRADLQKILVALRRRDIPTIVLKGIPLAERLYPQPELRPTSDIDIMVQRSDLSRAERVLESLEFVPPKNVALQDAFRQHHHHLAPYLHQHTKTVVELHWQVVRPDRPHQLDVAGIWDRAQETSVGGALGLVPAPEDQFLHLCSHFLGDRLGRRRGALLQLCDIILLLNRDGPSMRWDEVTDRILAQSLGPAIYTVLYATKLIPAAFYPEDVERRIRPAALDEKRARQFVIRRVIGTGNEVPAGLVQGLAALRIGGKVRGLRKALHPPAPWTPGGNSRVALTSERDFSLYLRRPLKVLGALGKAVFYLRQLRDQVLVERWLRLRS